MADPSTIAGLYNWYKADSITGVSDGGLVASWNDSAGGGFTLTNANSTKPTYVASSAFNAKPALGIFQNGSSGFLGNSSALGSQSTQTLTIVIRPTAFTATVLIAGATSGGLSLYVTTAGKIQVIKSGNAVIMTSATAMTLNTNYVVTVDFTASGAVNLYFNGTKDTNSTTTTQTLAANSGYAYVIGAGNNAASEPYRGFLAEVVHYNVVLGAASRASLHSYLQDKYAITVSDYVAAGAPSAVTGLTATASTGQVALSWTAGSGSPTSYKTYRRGTLIGTTASTSYAETGLPGGVKYDYTVVASNATGDSDPSAASATTPLALKPGAPNVIWDSDFSSDIDDLYAIALLHAFADLGEVNLVGMIVSSTNLGAAQAMNSINIFNGRPAIPIGVRSDVGGAGGYPASIAAAFPHTLTNAADFYNATTLYRTLLATDTSGKLVIITTGFLNTLNGLYASVADGIDSRTGPALIAAKVSRWWCMGGVYPAGDEFNFKSSGDNGASAYSLVNNWPSSVYYTGYEVGGPIYSGGTLLTVPQPDPRYTGASVYGTGGITATGTSSSDPLDVYLAVRFAEGMYGFNNTGRNTATTTGHNDWVSSPDPTGALDQGYVLERSRVPVQIAMNVIMAAVPAALPPQIPTAPTFLRVTTSGSTMVLIWSDNSYNETGFSIERLDSGTWAVIGTVGANLSTYTDSNPGTQTNRQYRVRATNAKGNSAYATAAYYASWTQTNITNPGVTPFYDFLTTDNLRWSLSSGADHTAILNDFVSTQTFTIDVDAAQIGTAGSMVVYFLYTDANNWYRFRSTSSATYFEKALGGTVTQIGATGSAPPTTIGTASQHWTISVAPTGYVGTIAGTAVATVTDTPTSSSGKTGLGGTGGATPVWSNYRTSGTAATASSGSAYTTSGSNTGTGTTTATIQGRYVGTGAVSGAGAARGTVVASYIDPGVASGMGTVTGTVSAGYRVSGAMAGNGSSSLTGVSSYAVTGSVTGRGMTTAVTMTRFTTNGNVTGTGKVYGELAGSSTAFGSTSGKGTTSGTVQAQLATAGSVSGRGAATGVATTAGAGSGALAGTGTVAGTVQARFIVTGVAIGHGTLGGTVLSTTLPQTGGTTGRGTLAGTARLNAVVLGGTTGRGRLAVLGGATGRVRFGTGNVVAMKYGAKRVIALRFGGRIVRL